jgi:hypothetical protein
MIRMFQKAAAVAALTVATASVASAQTNLLNVAGQARIQSQAPTPEAPLFIDFLSGGAFPPGNVGFGTPGNAFSGSSTGIFASIAGGTSGIMNDLTITPTSISTTPVGGSVLAIGAYTFTLGALVPATGGTLQFGPIVLEDRATGAVADLLVRGNVTGGACQPICTYDGVVTAQFAGQTAAQVFNQINAGGTPIVTFSANFNASVVPEPSTYALLATGISALGLVARRRRQQA